jgi:PAS domain S-box-containing protein
MLDLVHRARGWLRARIRRAGEWPCRDELLRLREQERRFTALLDSVEDAVVLTGRDERLRFANRAAARNLERVTGRPIADAIGKHPSEMSLPPALARHVEWIHEQLHATGAPVTGDLAMPLPGSGVRWFEDKSSPVFDDDGKVSGFILVGRDIDDRKRAQRRLELLAKVGTLVGLGCSELLPAIAELAIPELADWCAVDMRRDGEVLRTYVAHHDPTKAALAAELAHFHPWKRRPSWEALEAGESLLRPRLSDEDLRQNTDNEAHARVLIEIGIRSAMAVPLRLNERTLAILTFGTAESGRHFGPEDLALAEELARRAAVLLERAGLHARIVESENRFRMALAAGHTAVFEQDRELRYRWQYNSRTSGNAVGKRHEDFFAPDEAARLTAIKQRVLDTGEPLRQEVRLTLQGKPTIYMLTIDPLYDDHGAISGIIGAALDITEERRVQEELAQAVTFREELMGILGHDLRNPLGAISVATGMMGKRADLPPALREYVERIRRAGKRMNEMIRTILDFTQVRFHGALPVRPAHADLAEVAHAIVDELRAAEPERTIELDIRGDATGRFDAARVGELLSNLVGNALMHGGADEPVRVSLDADDDDVWLRVHNRGEAIAPEQKAALFEPFRRGPESGARSGGLGLGLYIVRQIVAAHGGTIAVESNADDGTTFIVRLPRGVAARASVAAAT